jgi:hypothetical protein
MRNAHEMIINYICEVVGREPVILQDYLVVNHRVIKHYFTMDNILKRSLTLRDSHSNDV